MSDTAPAEPQAPADPAPAAQPAAAAEAPPAAAPAPAAAAAEQAAPAPADAAPAASPSAAAAAASPAAGTEPRLPVRAYLEQTVVPVLMQGMMELNRKRPADPIEFLCNYLQQHNPKKEKKAASRQQGNDGSPARRAAVMVLVLCIGDLHIPHRCTDLPPKFKALLIPGKISRILCPGNLCIEAAYDYLRSVCADVTVTQGDFDESTKWPDTQVVSIGDFRVGICHGHQVVPAGDREALAILQRKLDADILVTGHTHEFKAYRHEDRLVISTGSATGAYSSATSSPTPSFALMDIDGGKAVVYVYELVQGDDGEPAVKVDKLEFTKPRGGGGGGGTALRLSNTLASYLGCTSVVKAGERCGEGPNYLGIAQRPAGQLVQPSAREGPTAHGLEHLPLGCRDCSGCDSSLRRCTAAETLEYIAVEFARDVSIQGPNFTTTQENIVLGYLAHAPPDVVVLNAGLHDTSLQDSSPEAYEANMRWYLGLFDALVPRPRLLVLGTTRVDRDKQPAEHREVTSNQRIHAYNSRAAALAAERGDMWLDPYHLLQLPLWQARNVDGAHYADQYYEVMAWDVLGMLCRAALTWPAGSPPPAPP
ncbi:Vacuolar sorting-associated 29 [Micractinium conductrix]|uniref:Vacuolar protein sorting-associated protein 29 n=1 Tax=Micractinium conductrix TaxID=554055 RepID=A0A2P6V8T2_9CHLO|nr:Vacuolar sorting-associated 29 [Micractinium conductrix]|eukprot:PSC70491.1 Vacuolar sorting-associated 29 [Micractinium conductrix]